MYNRFPNRPPALAVGKFFERTERVRMSAASGTLAVRIATVPVAL